MSVQQGTANRRDEPAHPAPPRPRRSLGCGLALAAVFGLALGTCPSSYAQTFTVLYSFAGYPTDGAGPEAGLVMDAGGNLYGTTLYGGNNGCCGTVFEITAEGKEKVLHSFCTTDCLDGAYPLAGLAIDAKGNLYGTASAGGVNRNGTVSLITPGPSHPD